MKILYFILIFLPFISLLQFFKPKKKVTPKHPEVNTVLTIHDKDLIIRALSDYSYRIEVILGKFNPYDPFHKSIIDRQTELLDNLAKIKNKIYHV